MKKGLVELQYQLYNVGRRLSEPRLSKSWIRHNIVNMAVWYKEAERVYSMFLNDRSISLSLDKTSGFAKHTFLRKYKNI